MFSASNYLGQDLGKILFLTSAVMYGGPPIFGSESEFPFSTISVLNVTQVLFHRAYLKYFKENTVREFGIFKHKAP